MHLEVKLRYAKAGRGGTNHEIIEAFGIVHDNTQLLVAPVLQFNHVCMSIPTGGAL